MNQGSRNFGPSYAEAYPMAPGVPLVARLDLSLSPKPSDFQKPGAVHQTLEIDLRCVEAGVNFQTKMAVLKEGA
jgi:hypothetical protein